MRYSIGSCFLSAFSGDGTTHADGFHLSAWLCDTGLSRDADRLARAASPHLLLAGLHASRAPRATHLGRDGPMDARHHHRLALWPPAQSGLLERPPARPLVGAGPAGHLAAASAW